ncbi:hypothetical protein BASA60_003140 [Batrachochytrium salamandrivorans]|nr:hypothetical protein BASA60_003140 [Batrachochytrium salamandrivorans]
MSLPAFYVNINFDDEKTKIGSFYQSTLKKPALLTLPRGDPPNHPSAPNTFTCWYGSFASLQTSLVGSKQVADRTIDTVEVALDDVEKFDQTGQLVHNIEENTKALHFSIL